MMNFLKALSPEVMLIAAGGFVALFGAIVHATAQLKVHRDKNMEFTKVDFFILVVIALFSGMVFGLSASLMTENVVLVILSTAIGAFLGMAGLNKLANVFLDLLVSSVGNKK